MENQEINVAELIAELNEKFKENTLTNKVYNKLQALLVLTSKVVDISKVDVESYIRTLVTNYCEDLTRYYHNFNHIDSMIEYVNYYINYNKIPLELEDSVALYTAIVFHDIVYDLSETNEEESANLFLKIFGQNREICDINAPWVSKDFYDKVVTLIFTTKKNPWSIDYHRYDTRYIILQADWCQFEDKQTAFICDELIMSEALQKFNMKKRIYNNKRVKFLKNILKYKDKFPEDKRLSTIEFLLKTKYNLPL